MEEFSELDFAKTIAEDICKSRNFEHEIEIHFTDDINTEKLKYLKREFTIDEYKKMDHSSLNGTALPFENNGFHIIIKNGNPEYYFTVAHECTHIIDYFEFMNNFNNGKIEIEQNPLYYSFGYYSEFNARFTAHLIMLNLYSTIDTNFNKDFEIESLTQLLIESYNNMQTVISVKEIYELMQLLGRWFSIEIATQKTYTLPCFEDLYVLLSNFHEDKSLENLTKLDSYFRCL